MSYSTTIFVIAIGMLTLPGCAIVSNRSFSSGESHLEADSGLRHTITTYPGAMFSSESIDLPPLLHISYQRPPFNISLHVEDTFQSFERLEITSVTIQYDGEEPQSVVPDKSVIKFEMGYLDYPEIRQNIGEVDRHKKVTVTVKATAIRINGTAVELELSETFHPTSFHRATDWFSWIVSS